MAPIANAVSRGRCLRHRGGVGGFGGVGDVDDGRGAPGGWPSWMTPGAESGIVSAAGGGGAVVSAAADRDGSGVVRCRDLARVGSTGRPAASGASRSVTLTSVSACGKCGPASGSAPGEPRISRLIAPPGTRSPTSCRACRRSRRPLPRRTTAPPEEDAVAVTAQPATRRARSRRAGPRPCLTGSQRGLVARGYLLFRGGSPSPGWGRRAVIPLVPGICALVKT